jgi:hypothetical protein
LLHKPNGSLGGNMTDVRKYTNFLWDRMDEEVLSATFIAHMCLKYMSEDEVKDMMRLNDLLDLVGEY